ncbi:MAG: methyltransferase domain-containing protein [Candidatus Aenigmarchaeota archaeon]|nr:methyltransferase domain-containing protein [Candidatus Aenigmarchaeota archaeon]
MRTHRKLVFKMYQKLLDSLNLKNPNVIELGCGSGMLTLKILKKYGGSATVLDNSKEALKLAEEKFKKHNFKAKILCRDLLRFKPKKKFDIVHSEGLIEHFSNEKQKKIIETHKKCVKKNGYILITVPRPAWYYRITKWFLEKINKWPFGFEKAMSKNELKKVLEKYGLKVVKFAEYSRYSFALAKI